MCSLKKLSPILASLLLLPALLGSFIAPIPAAAQHSVKTTWDNQNAIPGQPAAQANIYRDGVKIATVDAATVFQVIDTMVLAGGVYHYGVSFTGANGAESAIVTVPTEPPAIPGGVTPPPTFTTVRINACGPAYTDSTGAVWAADPSGPTGNGNCATYTHAITGALPAAADQTLYKSERWGASRYDVAAPAGSYNVTLKFVENSFGAGKRKFNASINGVAVLTNFDIAATAGGEWKAIDRTFTVSTTGAAIAIAFTAGTADQPLINAIQIAQAGSPPVAVAIAPTAATLLVSQTQQFTASVTGSANAAVTWSSSIGNITPAGLFTAPVAVGPGTVTATSQADPTKSATASVQVNAPAPSITANCAWLADGVTRRCDFLTSNVPSGTPVDATATAGSASVTDHGTKP